MQRAPGRSPQRASDLVDVGGARSSGPTPTLPCRIVTDVSEPVVVVGAGPAGLAVAAELRSRGIDALVLEAGDQVGTSWRRHYDRLHLHTIRRWSALPGLDIPRSFGRWVGRDDLIAYLEQYAQHHELRIETGVTVERVDRASGDWSLTLDDGRVLTTPVVVVATGYNHTPTTVDHPGREGFTGEVLHARDYRNAAPFAGRSVLVVGPGNTGAEIAVDLGEGGATAVWLAVRTPPHVLRRATGPIPSQATGIAVRHLPVGLVDQLARIIARLGVPDLRPYGLQRPPEGLYTRVRQGVLPILDVGFVTAVRARRVEPVAAFASFDGSDAVLVDGRRLTPDVVLFATGYTRALEPLVGHLGVLDEHGTPVVPGGEVSPRAPGLYFVGFTTPISGTLRELGIHARKVAASIMSARTSPTPSP